MLYDDNQSVLTSQHGRHKHRDDIESEMEVKTTFAVCEYHRGPITRLYTPQDYVTKKKREQKKKLRETKQHENKEHTGVSEQQHKNRLLDTAKISYNQVIALKVSSVT